MGNGWNSPIQNKEHAASGVLPSARVSAPNGGSFQERAAHVGGVKEKLEGRMGRDLDGGATLI